MGWIAVQKSGEILREGEHGRPVQAGEEGNLLFIFQEDAGQKIAVDLINGVIIIGYDDWYLNNGSVELSNPVTVMHICDETNIVGYLFHTESTEPDEKGDYANTYIPLTWRPIWFTRSTAGQPTKVIGAQTTLPKEYGGRNVKKMVSIFEWGALGID
jgi:hypothetical protein